MALDDDASKPGEPISPESEPLKYGPPDNRQIEPTILKAADDYPTEDQFFIRRALYSRGYKVSQAVVDDVLKKHNRHNLHLGS